MICVNCGHLSADGEKVCGNCNAPLVPGNKDTEAIKVPYCRAPYLDLDSWVKGFEIGAISPEEFKRRLQERADKYKNRLEEVQNYEIPAEMRDTMSEEYNCGRRGIEGLYSAVQQLLEYADNKDTGCRDAALSQADVALNLLHRAMCLNVEASQVLASSLEDMVSKAQGGQSDVGGFETGGFMMGEMNIAGM